MQCHVHSFSLYAAEECMWLFCLETNCKLNKVRRLPCMLRTNKLETKFERRTTQHNCGSRYSKEPAVLQHSLHFCIQRKHSEPDNIKSAWTKNKSSLALSGYKKQATKMRSSMFWGPCFFMCSQLNSKPWNLNPAPYLS